MKTLKHILPTLLLTIFLGITFSITAQQKAKLNVSVTDFENKPLAGEQIIFVDQHDKSTFNGISNEDGIFSIELVGGKIYDIKIKSVGEATDYNTLEIPAIGPNEMYGENSMQIMIEQPQLLTLENVFFDTGKSTLKPSSYDELDELVQFLKLKPGTKIEISGHTDNVGSMESNLELSKNRAKTVMNYLTQHGIDKSRLTAKGYGSTMPIADNSTEMGRKQNRRTEVHFIN